MQNIITNNIKNGTNNYIVKVNKNKYKNILKEEKEEKRIELEDGGYYLGEITEDEIPNGKGKYFLRMEKHMKEVVKKINSKEMENIFMKMENII